MKTVEQILKEDQALWANLRNTFSDRSAINAMQKYLKQIIPDDINVLAEKMRSDYVSNNKFRNNETKSDAYKQGIIDLIKLINETI